MRHLILIRHGESQLNVTNRTRRVYCGQFNTPLTDKGRQGATAVGGALAKRSDLRIEAAISSALDRAVETLSLILKQLPESISSLPASSDLNERSLGLFEGRTPEDVFAEHPQYQTEAHLRRFQNDFEQHAPQGENLTQVGERAWRQIQSTLASTQGDLLVVSHFNTMRSLLWKAGMFAQEEVLPLRIANTTPIVVQVAQGQWNAIEGLKQ